ncbi:hypothetical protein EDC96DRAFT_447970 [Choanephora cucurbitarum]|nr:hypothetical protein EDC96DRAFT_447970 [Choanephora cucurbitarum]
MAMRMAMELGLHEELEDSEECCDSEMSKSWSQEYRRRLLWVLYCTDKISSAATGKPPSLSNVYCHVFLPSSDHFKMDQYYAENLDGSRYVMNNPSGLQDSQLLSASDAPANEDNSLSRRSPLNAFAYFVRIIDLLGRVSTYVNSKRRDSSNFVPPCNPDSDFQQLDRAIDTWYDELPMHLKNTPANFELSQSSSETTESRLFTIIHIVHNTLIVLLHRPSLVASDTLYSHLIQPSIKQFISSSVEKCTAAVENVTVLLKEVIQRKECGTPFMSYFVYTVATVVVSNSFSPRKEEAQKAKQALGVYFQFLLNARGLWAMADQLYFMIRDLYTIHSNILRQQQQKRPKEVPAENTSPLSSVRSSQQSLLQPFPQESLSYPMQTLPLQQQQGIDQLSSVNNSLADWTLPYYMNALAVPTNNSLENGDVSSLFQIPQAFNEPFLYNNNNNSM